MISRVLEVVAENQSVALLQNDVFKPKQTAFIWSSSSLQDKTYRNLDRATQGPWWHTLIVRRKQVLLVCRIMAKKKKMEKLDMNILE